MTRDEFIEQYLGSQALIRLKNKKLGGGNNQKGALYEEHFLLHRVILDAAKFIFLSADVPIYEAQPYAFVDDLLIVYQGNQCFYQIKNVSTGQGWASLQADFSYQLQLAKEVKQDVSLVLVCSNLRNQKNLNKKMPKEIELHTKVVFFPYYESPTQYIYSNSCLRLALQKLHRDNSDNFADLQAVLGVLSMAVKAFPKGGSLKDIYSHGATIFPQTLVLPDIIDITLDKELVNMFEQANIAYDIKNGFLTLRAMGTELRLPFHLSTPEFASYRKRILSLQPFSFINLERVSFYD